MGIKSLVVQVRVDVAIRGHNCQANARHRIEKGNVRLKVRKGRSWDHYCSVCAKAMFARDIAKLTALQNMTPEIMVGD
jgi:hypothetical protein